MEFLKQLKELINAKISVYKTAYSLLSLEAQLARLSIVPLLLTIFMLFIVLITVWLSITILIGYSFFLIFNRPILAFFLIIFLNIGLILGLIRYLSFNIKNMSFEKTRAYFFQNKSMQEELEKINKNLENKN
ncbi:hypothetical protein [Legionella sp. PC997]|uniref:hypothetical protein n=1 Tax=Legionella sp. PC997 TaxID=2755562 RepID=UPI0015F8AD3A|nr:hypothetical protein [Legionella sp. PC997]QMT59795.1 hypothetical protein HBNCFIEN_01162 [Legionella sp. PC997]